LVEEVVRYIARFDLTAKFVFRKEKQAFYNWKGQDRVSFRLRELLGLLIEAMLCDLSEIDGCRCQDEGRTC